MNLDFIGDFVPITFSQMLKMLELFNQPKSAMSQHKNPMHILLKIFSAS